MFTKNSYNLTNGDDNDSADDGTVTPRRAQKVDDHGPNTNTNTSGLATAENSQANGHHQKGGLGSGKSVGTKDVRLKMTGTDEGVCFADSYGGLPAAGGQKAGGGQVGMDRQTEAGAEGECEEGDKSTCCSWRQRNKRPPTVGVLELFRYARPLEILMMTVGTVAAAATGCGQPLSMLVWGQTLTVFLASMDTNNTNSSTGVYNEDLVDNIQPQIIYFVILGSGMLVASYTATSMWSWAGERQITNIRKKFFRGVLRQNIGWFDTHDVGELNSRFSADVHNISEGMGEKVPMFLQGFSTWIFGYVLAFVYNWKLTLVALALSPIQILVTAAFSRMLRSMAGKELKAYARAGSVAEQALRAIRTVYAFQGQEKEQSRYEENLVLAKTVGTRKGVVLGMGQGSFTALIYITFAVCFYYGVVLTQDENMLPGEILVVLFGVLVGNMNLGNALPNLESFANARAAAVKVFEIIDLCPPIDISSKDGQTLTSLQGVIEFKDVHFHYPARPEVQVLSDLNITVRPGETVAMVGASGCGKSTTVQLLQRFYDPTGGQVLVDGHDIKDLNLKWLRDQIGVVNQEPVLFAATIGENIRYGKPDASQEEVEAAAQEANAHDFIVKLPQGYDTLVGERGAQLSGGQKQRIAIARALVKNPRILLLDEATSALDHESEAVVQVALERVQEGRTTLIIAHRLSTIRNADRIVALSHGRKKEEGSHDHLMALDGLYAQLVRLQTTAEEEDGGDINDIDIVEMDDQADESGSHKMAVRSISSTSDKSRTRASFRLKEETKAASKDDQEEEKSDEETEEKKKAAGISAKRLLRLNSPEWLYLLLGTIMTFISGLSTPAFAFIFSEFLQVFSLRDKEEQLDKTVILCAVMLGVGFVVVSFRGLSGLCFGKSGSELTARVRKMTFQSLMKQEMSFYDDKDNHVGALTTRLAGDATMVQGATGSKLAGVLEALGTILASLVIAFVYGWQLALVVLAFFPVMFFSGKMRGRAIAGSAKSEKSQLQEAGKICSEAIDNIPTIASVNREDVFVAKFDGFLDSLASAGVRTSHVFGITYGMTASVIYFAFAASYAYGAQLVADGEMEYFHVFRVFTAIIMGGSVVGRNASYSMDYNKARVAASRLFAIIDRESKINIDIQGGKQLANYQGRVELDRVGFVYPTRDTVPVLNGLSLQVEPGQTLALVGASGCGKSTVLQIMQRFYDIDSGALLVDGEDLRDVDLRWFRRQLGIVSQEPTLFDDSIAANIAYGDNSRTVPMDEIIASARAANIHSFIEQLPQGYDTNVGDKGTQLSGGQKQRVAIARALVRRPKVLLLDEATSALDTESERVVQDALDKAREGRTSIVIAHRLTTIQNADVIAVIQDGRVQEKGTHAQLLASEGTYYRLLQAQNVGRKSSLAIPEGLKNFRS